MFERVCKAAQLAVMVGFASAGTRFTTRVQGDNVWAFQSLSFLLAVSRTLLAVQYTLNGVVIHKRMKDTVKGMASIVATLVASSIVYLGVSLFLRSLRWDTTDEHSSWIVCSYTLPSKSEAGSSPSSGPFGSGYLGSRCGR